jgi:chromatin remodeling complex protein RSC6
VQVLSGFQIVSCFLVFASALLGYFSPRLTQKAKLIHAPGFSRSVHPKQHFMPTAKSTRKPNAALMKPVQPDDTLAKIVGSKPLPRSELTKKIWDYIKKNKLQDAKKKTLINADDALKAVFGGKKQVTMFEMTKHISGHVK